MKTIIKWKYGEMYMRSPLQERRATRERFPPTAEKNQTVNIWNNFFM